MVRLFVKFMHIFVDLCAKLVSRTLARHAPRRSMKFVNTYIRTSPNLDAITFLAIVAITSFSSAALRRLHRQRAGSGLAWSYTRAWGFG
jgi:hypothetical protein